MQPQQPTPDIATLSYRMANMEKDIEIVQKQLQSYVPLQVNDWQLREKDVQIKSMQQTLDRMEREQQNSKKEWADLLSTMNTKIDSLKTKNLERIVSVLLGTIGGVLVTIIGTGLVYFFTHTGG